MRVSLYSRPRRTPNKTRKRAIAHQHTKRPRALALHPRDRTGLLEIERERGTDYSLPAPSLPPPPEEVHNLPRRTAAPAVVPAPARAVVRVPRVHESFILLQHGALASVSDTTSRVGAHDPPLVV